MHHGVTNLYWIIRGHDDLPIVAIVIPGAVPASGRGSLCSNYLFQPFSVLYTLSIQHGVVGDDLEKVTGSSTMTTTCPQPLSTLETCLPQTLLCNTLLQHCSTTRLSHSTHTHTHFRIATPDPLQTSLTVRTVSPDKNYYCIKNISKTPAKQKVESRDPLRRAGKENRENSAAPESPGTEPTLVTRPVKHTWAWESLWLQTSSLHLDISWWEFIYSFEKDLKKHLPSWGRCISHKDSIPTPWQCRIWTAWDIAIHNIYYIYIGLNWLYQELLGMHGKPKNEMAKLLRTGHRSKCKAALSAQGVPVMAVIENEAPQKLQSACNGCQNPPQKNAARKYGDEQHWTTMSSRFKKTKWRRSVTGSPYITHILSTCKISPANPGACRWCHTMQQGHADARPERRGDWVLCMTAIWWDG